MATVISGNTQISIIQGDSYQKSIEITNVDTELIESIVFSCKALNLTRELTKSLIGNKYELYFTATETLAFSVFNSSYDLTVKFKDSKIKTIVYNSFIEVLPKNNTLSDEEDVIVERSITITHNGEQEISEENKAFSKINLNVNVPVDNPNKIPQIADKTIKELTFRDLDGAKVVSYGVFQNFNELVSVEIPESVTEIYNNAFNQCGSLLNVTISKNVTRMQQQAFYLGTSTHQMTIKMLCENPPTIQYNTFYSSSIKEIIVPNGSKEAYSSATNWSRLASLIVEATE